MFRHFSLNWSEGMDREKRHAAERKKQEDTEIERRVRFEEMEKQNLNDSKIRFSKSLTCII